jgi:putative sterol carrier protein
MTDADAIKQLEKTVELDGEDLRRELPPVLERFDDETTRTLARDHPDVFGDLVRGLEDADVAAFVDESPEASEDYQDVLWTGLATLVEDDEGLQSKINLDVTVNFEADDCAMEGHLLLDSSEGTLSGGAGAAVDPDLTIGGPAGNIVGLVTGDVDPVQGFMQGSYEMDGSLSTGTRLAPVIKALAKAIPGE